MDNIYFRGKEFGTVPANQNNLQQDNIDIGGPDLSPMLKFSDLLQVFPNRDEFTSTRDTAKGSWFVQVNYCGNYGVIKTKYFLGQYRH